MKNLDRIIADCKKGKRSAQAQLYNEFAPTLYAICLRYCSCSQDAEDCLHDAIVKIFDKISKYQGKGSFEGWLKRIVVNHCIDRCRATVHFSNVEENEMKAVEVEEIADPYANIENQALFNAINNLPPAYKVVFNLHAIEGYKHTEIANELGITESSSRSNYLRARKILSSILEPQLQRANS